MREQHYQRLLAVAAAPSGRPLCLTVDAAQPTYQLNATSLALLPALAAAVSRAQALRPGHPKAQ